MNINVSANVDYVDGHLRSGHYELEMDKDIFTNLSKEDLKSYIKENGDFIVDDHRINDIGDITDISIM